MRLELLAALAGTNSHAKWLSVDSEGAARIVLETPADQLPQVIRMALFAGKSFKLIATDEE